MSASVVAAIEEINEAFGKKPIGPLIAEIIKNSDVSHAIAELIKVPEMPELAHVNKSHAKILLLQRILKDAAEIIQAGLALIRVSRVCFVCRPI